MTTKTRNELLVGSAYIICLIFLFSPGLFRSQIPAFRDGYHFYYPQAVWLEHCAKRGEYFPSWNPTEGLGVSVTGQPSSALYYPLRAVWLLPWLSLPQRYALYMLVHVVLAGLGMRFAANALRLPKSVGWLAALSYSLSCPVLFQHSNLIFLCSAAWVGFALGAILQFLSSKSRYAFTSCLVFTVACSLMFFAGDPHTALNAVVLAVVALGSQAFLALVAALRSREKGLQTQIRQGLRNVGWLFTACCLIASCTSIQWIPTLRWSSRSSRLANESLTTRAETSELSAILMTSPATPHPIYDFSISPWHTATMIWPTLGGHYLPQHSRVFAAIPSEGRMWIPSLYFGALPCFFMASLFARAIPSRKKWSLRNQVVVLGLIGLLGMTLGLAFGNYSIVWIMREGLQGLGLEGVAKLLPNDHVGSFYWILTRCIPGYAVFRYPGKWSVWAAAAASLLAAVQLSRNLTSSAESALALRISRTVFLLSAIGLFISILFWIAASLDATTGIDHWLAVHARDRLLGAPTSQAIGQSCTIAFAIPTYTFLFFRRLRTPTAICVFTILEMTLAASQWMVFAQPPPSQHATLPSSTSQFVWASTNEEPSLIGKLSTLEYARALHVTQSIEPAEIQRLRRWLSDNDTLASYQPNLDIVLAQLGVNERRVVNGLSSAMLQPIAAAAPFCELTHGSVGGVEEAGIQWAWRTSSELRIVVHGSLPKRLIVRQYNDGGWICRTNHGNSIEPKTNRLFVEVELPAGETEFYLRRKWLW
jgi:hypothetical protein